MKSRPLIFLSFLALCFPACGKRGGSSSNAPLRIDRYQEVADFSFTNQEAETVTRADLAGKVWVANFVFTSCGAECLILSQKMAALQNRFSNREDVAFASFSVDPQTDSPERLASYAKRWGADSEKWQFFTGDGAELDAIIKQSFLLPSSSGAREQAKLMTASFVHSNKLAVVDRQGVVRAYVEGLESNAIDQVSRAIETLLAEPFSAPQS